jgi:hypothetical protein
VPQLRHRQCLPRVRQCHHIGHHARRQSHRLRAHRRR